MGLNTERVVLVTGASRGIGRGTAVALAAPATTIYVTGRTTQAGTAALPGTIQLQLVGKESVPIGQETRELNHYRAVTEQVQIELWATPEGAIYRLTIPQADLEVVRR